MLWIYFHWTNQFQTYRITIGFSKKLFCIALECTLNIYLDKSHIYWHPCRFYSRERIGYAIGHSCSAVRIKRRGWFRHVVCWRCQLCFFAFHGWPFIFGLAFNNYVVYFKIIVRMWCGCYACNKVGLIPLDEEGKAIYSFPLSKKI